MREIKFRAWDAIAEKMVCARDHAYYQNYVSFCGNIIQHSSEGMEYFGGGDRWRVESDLQLMQYTGLKDKDGVEIYEGDVVSMWYAPLATSVGVITMDNCSFWFNTEDSSPSKSHLGDIESFGNYLTVIGNIYENPELIKGES